MPPLNPKNYPGGAAAADLGLSMANATLETEDEKKKKLLEQQQNRLGRTGSSVYGQAAMSLFSDAGLPNG